MDYQVTFRGLVHDSQGLSRASREYILALDSLGVDIRVEPMNFGTSPVKLLPSQSKRLKELIAKPRDSSKKNILLYSLQPNGVDPIMERGKGFDKVIINTVWETTKIPDFWFPNINFADAVFVPSTQNIKALKDSGVTVPVYLAPHGADVETYRADAIPMELLNAQDTYNFLSVFQWQHRKGPDVLLEAYWREFNKEDNVSLIIKTYWGNKGYKHHQRAIMESIMGYKKHLGFTSEDTAPTYFTSTLLDDTEMVKMYALGDVYVQPSRGEGVGLPYIEAMSCGIPCIATGWGGQTDFINDTNGLFVDYKFSNIEPESRETLAPNFCDLFTPNMQWAEPSVEDMQRKLRFAYENQSLMEEKGRQSRLDMEKMTWIEVGKVFKESIEKVI